MSEAFGVVAFHGGFMEGVIKGWRSEQEWPPPEQMIAAKHREGMMAVLPADDEWLVENIERLQKDCWVGRYVRTRHSTDQPLVAHYGFDGALR